MKDLPAPVTLTDRAAEEVRKIMARKDIPAGYVLRVGVRGTGCGSASSMLLGFDKVHDQDQSYLDHGIPLVVDKRQALYVFGKQVDYVDSEQGTGFTFI
jgi:iron-sulfur cluster assembly protein